MKKMIIGTLVSVSLMTTAPAFADGLLGVKITNLTNATYFTPLLVAAHRSNIHLFRGGEHASAHLQAMAEGGDISGLSMDVTNTDGNVVENPAGGLLTPGASTSTTIAYNPYGNSRISIVAMLLPTNDGFVGLDSLPIPANPGTYTYNLNGYDAGTEANDEIVNGGGAPGVPGIPADPGGNAGSGAAAVAGLVESDRVHVHPGVIGDPAGMTSDLNPRVHRFQSPVARLTLTVGGGW